MIIASIAITPSLISAQVFTKNEINRYSEQAKSIKIIRDNYGIPHIYGTTDADAVFGLLYAQCEDDFKRIELNYIEKLGRLSEINGEKDLYNDLQIQLLIDTTEAKNDYNNAEPWLKKLMNAYADGINYFLYKNPQIKPQLLQKFKPWYALLWTDGSIGAISTGGASINELKNFYSGVKNYQSYIPAPPFTDHQTGSNGFAFAPSKTINNKAILYINPHVTFYFRPEVHMQSKEGLNTYGAVTWGQFFIYQGFNQYCGWMHTSSAVDVADLYEETIIKKDGKIYSKYDNDLIPVREKQISIKYKTTNGIETKTINAFYTNHGPVVAQRGNKWIALKSYNRSMKSLMQSWLRTKATGFDDFKKTMDIKANTSNNTVYADNKGNIAYWHGNFIPIRDSNYDWSKPVDGSISKTEWKGLHPVEESVHVYNPSSGWLQNCNSTPFTAAGFSSPKPQFYPTYMAPDGENFRGINSVRLLNNSKKYSINDVIEIGYEPTLEAFKILIPGLINAYKQSKDKYPSLSPVIDTLTKWDYKSAINSVATTIAVEWAQRLNSSIQKVYINSGEADQVMSTQAFVNTATPDQFLTPLLTTIEDLTKRHTKWNVKWGDINRFQRIDDAIQARHNDTEPSFPVGQASALWGQLASFNSRAYPGTNNRYGYSGNSFVCVVEFGEKIKAKSLLAGGNSGNKNSPNFNDQGLMFSRGEFKEVLFYDEEIEKNAARIYKPGD